MRRETKHPGYQNLKLGVDKIISSSGTSFKNSSSYPKYINEMISITFFVISKKQCSRLYPCLIKVAKMNGVIFNLIIRSYHCICDLLPFSSLRDVDSCFKEWFSLCNSSFTSRIAWFSLRNFSHCVTNFSNSPLKTKLNV